MWRVGRCDHCALAVVQKATFMVNGAATLPQKQSETRVKCGSGTPLPKMAPTDSA